jgi:uncharacterized protein
MMGKRASAVAAATAMFAMIASGADAQMVGIGSTKGTAVAQMTAAISKVVSEYSGIQMRTQAMGGTQQYIPVVNAGQLEFGVGNTFQTYEAMEGIGLSKGHKYDNLRLVATLMTFTVGFQVPVKENIRKMSQMKGKRIPFGFSGAPLFQTFMEGFLANGGLTFADVEHVPAIGLAQSWNLLKEGKVDGVIAATGTAANQEMNTRIAGGTRYVDFDTTGPGPERTLALIKTTYYKLVQPAKDIPVVKEPSHLLAYDFTMWTNKNVPDATIEKVVKALYEHADELKSSSAIWRLFSREEMGKDQGTVLQYHPAAIAYYKKIGIWGHAPHPSP